MLDSTPCEFMIWESEEADPWKSFWADNLLGTLAFTVRFPGFEN